MDSNLLYFKVVIAFFYSLLLFVMMYNKWPNPLSNHILLIFKVKLAIVFFTKWEHTTGISKSFGKVKYSLSWTCTIRLINRHQHYKNWTVFTFYFWAFPKLGRFYFWLLCMYSIDFLNLFSMVQSEIFEAT